MTTQNALNTQLVLPSGSTAINSLLYTSAANVVTGLAPVNSGLLATSVAGAPTWLGPLTNGQIIIGSTGAIPVAASLTAGTNVTITPGAGTITINATASGTVNSGTANQLAYYATTGTAISGLTSGNNGILVTSNTGVPSIATTFGQGLAVASSVLGVGAANNIPFNTGKGFQDNNGNSLLLFTVTASAVNYWNMTNAATASGVILSATGSDANVTAGIFTKGLGQFQFGNNVGANTIFIMAPVASSVNYIIATSSITGGPPFLQAQGSDTNIALSLIGKGNLAVNIAGTTAGTNAPTGYVGELISSVIASGSASSISAATPKNVTSISLTEGDWDVYGNVTFLGSATTLQICLAWISATSATLPDSSLYAGFTTVGSQMSGFHAVAPYFRASLSATTTIYLGGYMTLAAGTCTTCGGIYARRVR